MPTFDYAKTRATADRLLTKFGRTATLHQGTIAGGEPWDPGSGTPTTTDTAVTVAVIDWENSQIDGTLIRATDRHVLMSAQGLAVTPQPDDQLIVGGETLTLVEPLKQINPGGIVVLYDMNASGSGAADDEEPPDIDAPILNFSIASNSQYIGQVA